MALSGIDHVAIAVPSLEEATESYSDLLGDEPEYEVVEQQGVRIAVFDVGDSRIELLEPLEDDNAIGRFLEEHGQGVHHVALRTDSVDQELDRVMDQESITCIDESPRDGAQGYRIAFLHPKDLSGALIELAQPSASD